MDNHWTITRRNFGLLAGTSLVNINPGARAETNNLTANQLIERIKQHVGVPWETQTVDTFKAGSPSTQVKGICTTVMATMDVLKQSAASGKNLIITHEPTFWNHLDETKDFDNDPVYSCKQSFIRENDLVVWRFHDHWHRRQPDGILTGLMNTLEWSRYQKPDATGAKGNYQGRQYFVLPQMSLRQLAETLQTRLKSRVTRVVGSPQAPVTNVALEPGYSSLAAAMKTLEREDVQVLVVGEPREWEAVEYVKDAVACQKNKALIILGHATSEDPGMEECARWLRTFITEVPIQWIPAGEPFWTPA